MGANLRNHVVGAAHRATITQRLLDAGADGLRVLDVMAATGLGHTAASYYLLSIPEAVQAVTRNHLLVRWFHADFKDAAASYVEQANSRTAPRRRWSEQTCEAAVKAIVDAGEGGITRKRLTAMFGLHETTIGSMCMLLEKQGAIKRQVGSENVVTYFGPSFDVATRVYKTPTVKAKKERQPRPPRVAKPKVERPHKMQKRAADKPLKPRRTPSAANKAWNSAGLRGGDFEPIYTGRERKIVAPPPRSRFQVDSPTPFFSAMPPGVYTLRSGSNVARAYGEPA